MARESAIESKCVEIAESEGWLVRKCVYVGRRASPDRWMMRYGRLLLIEFKREGKAPTKQQEREHERLAAAGFPVFVIDDVSEFRRVLASHP